IIVVHDVTTQLTSSLSHLVRGCVSSALFPYTTLFRSFCGHQKSSGFAELLAWQLGVQPSNLLDINFRLKDLSKPASRYSVHVTGDRKSTRLNSSHVQISYAVFCLKKKLKYGQARAPHG